MTIPTRASFALCFGIAACVLGCDVGSVVPPEDAGLPAPPAPSDAGDAGPMPNDEPIGWASMPDLGLEGTTGGLGGEVIEVDSALDPPGRLEAVLSGTVPRIVRLSGRFTGEVRVGSNKTLIGNPGAVLEGDLHVSGVSNVIVRNLTVIGANCLGDPQCSSGEDAVAVNSGSHHVWIDHLDISDGSDGNLDITQAADYVTVSWTKFWYSGTARGHRFSNLIGASDDSPGDVGHLKVTFHHNHWADNADQRMPRTRYGLIHVFNNFYASTGNSYCVNAGFQASLLVENNVFLGVESPHEVSDSGNLLARGNLYDNVTGDQAQTGVAFEPPYAYVAEPTVGLADAIMAGAGPE